MSLATLDQLKEYLSIVDNVRDVFLQNCLNRADDYIRTYCGADFTQQIYTELYDGTGSDTLLLDHLPIATSPLPVVLEFGKSLVVGTDPSATPQPDVLVYPKTGLVRPYNLFMPYRGWYKVTYTAGYAAIPSIVQQASLDGASLIMREPERLGLASKSTERHVVTFLRELPGMVRDGLDQYRDYGLGQRARG